MEDKKYEEQEYVNPYSRPIYETAEEYNQANREARDYTQQYNYQQYANMGGQMVDGSGNPLKNHFAIQLVFAIIEILLCCFSPVAMILGIIGLVFAVQANTSFQLGKAEEFKAKSKTSNILLIIGGALAIFGVIINIVVGALYITTFKEMFSKLENELQYGDEWLDDSWNDEEDETSEDEVYEDYPGTDEVPLTEGFANFTHKGIAYTVPMSYDDFLTMGYVLEDGYENYIIGAQSYESIWFYDEDGMELGSIRISNDTESELTLEECVVDYIYFDNPGSYLEGEEHIDLVFGTNFNMFTTYEELEAWLGTPYYVQLDHSGESEYASYEWLYYGEDKYQSIVVNYLDGVITDIAFEQYDFVY